MKTPGELNQPTLNHPYRYSRIVLNDDDPLTPIKTDLPDFQFFYTEGERFICIVHRLPNEKGNMRYLTTYLVATRPNQVVIVANIGSLMEKVLSVISTRRALLFRIENDYPKIAQGLKWEWPRFDSGIAASHFPGSDKMYWFACLPIYGVGLDTFRETEHLSKFLNDQNPAHFAYWVIFQICNQLFAEAYTGNLWWSINSFLSGLLSGTMIAVSKKYRRQLWDRWKDWTLLLDALEYGDDEAIEREVDKLHPDSSFVLPNLLNWHDEAGPDKDRWNGDYIAKNS